MLGLLGLHSCGVKHPVNIIPPAQAQTAPVRPTPPQCIVGTALAEVGVKEATGNNDGSRVEEYLASVKLGKGYPWCAAFVHWSHRQCGIVLEPAREFAAAARFDAQPVWRPSGWSPETDPYTPISEDGDVGTIWSQSLGRISHCFIITDEEKDYLTTDEGNTNAEGSREGNVVAKRKRLKKSIHSVCRWWD